MIRINKKVLALILIIILLGIFYLIINFLSPKKDYVENPLLMKNLGVSTQELDISELSKIESVDIPVYFVRSKIHTVLVEQFVKRISINLEKEEVVKDTYFKWSDEKNLITYDTYTDKVIFDLEKGIPVQLGEEILSSFYLNYFDSDFKVPIVEEEKEEEGGVRYLGNRVVDDIPIEFGFNKPYSAILEVDQEGKAIYGELLLAEIDKYETYIPTIKDEELKRYVNAPEYPKEHYLDTSVLVDTLSLYDYLDPAWGEMEKNTSGCKATDSELILLFKNTEQGYLLPVYRMSANCDVEYKNQLYSVPATFYLNAVDPMYVTNTN